MDEQFAKSLEKALDREVKHQAGNGPPPAKMPTLTEKVDEVIEELHHRIKLIEAFRSTL